MSVVSTSAYNHLADAADLLDESSAPYAGGKGMRLSGQGPALPDHGVQSEWEWPLVIRRYADGAMTNEAGDRFAFRLVDVTGRPLPAPATPEVTASVPPRLLGGTFPETPGRLGPWEPPDGSLVGAYGGPNRIHYKIRGPDGTWGTDTTVPSKTGDALSGPQTTLGADGTVHLAYTRRDGTGWHRRIREDGRLSPPTHITSNLGTTEADIGAILPLVHLPESTTTVLLYRRASGQLWARRVAHRYGPG